MKRVSAAALFALCFSSHIYAQTYGLDNTNPAVFSNFKIPETKLSSLSFGGGFNYGSNNYIQYGFGAPSNGTFNSNLSLSLSPGYYLIQESDDRYLSVDASAHGSVQDQYSRYTNPLPSPSGSTKQSLNEVNLRLRGTYRNYLDASDLFYSLGSTGGFNLQAQYSSSTGNYTSESYYGMKSQLYSFAFGLGFGKIRDVTSVVSAIRFQERLKQLSLLNEDLNEKTIEDLAQQFYRQGYYGDVHVRPDRFFWQDVEKTLSNDGVSLAGLNQYADSYLREVPNELRFNRVEGILGGINLQFDYSNDFATSGTGNYSLVESFFAMANAYVQLSHQLNLNSELTFSLGLSGGPNIVRDSPYKQQYLTNAAIGYNYELTDRLVVSASNSLDLQFRNFGGQAKSLLERFGLTGNYFVEDNISLYASYSWNYSDSKNIDAVQGHISTVYNYAAVGLTYYISRGFLYK